MNPQVKISESEAVKELQEAIAKDDSAFEALKNSLAYAATGGKK